jgi:hypothetical protein
MVNIIEYIINNLSKHNKNQINPLLEPIEDYLDKYFKEIKKNILPVHSKYKNIIFCIHIIHVVIVVFFILFGLFLPPRLQIYVVLIYTIIMLSWVVYGRCILVILTNYLGGTDLDYLFPFKWETMYIVCSILILISLLFYIFPYISPFNILLYLHNI